MANSEWLMVHSSFLNPMRMPLFPHRIAYNRLFWVGEGNDILLVGKSIISEIIKNYGYPGLLGDGGIGNGELEEVISIFLLSFLLGKGLIWWHYCSGGEYI